MCQCNPSIRTPYCGVGECEWPHKKKPREVNIPCWKPGMTAKEAKDVAYAERNLLALRYADGWYYDRDNNWEGWTRVLSLDDGKLTFHIPDDLDVGNLPEIAPNWDGHTTEEKWSRVLKLRGVE